MMAEKIMAVDGLRNMPFFEPQFARVWCSCFLNINANISPPMNSCINLGVLFSLLNRDLAVGQSDFRISFIEHEALPSQ